MRLVLIVAVGVASICDAAALAQKNEVERAATEPLRDTRLKEDVIPPILQQAASAPYATHGMTSCPAIAAEVRRLDTALGADVDVPGKAKGEGSAVAAAAAGEAVRSLIPGLGVVRVVTGADKQQHRVEAAVYAGAVRRGYLKGLGLSMHCTPPAAPTQEARVAVPTTTPPPAKK
jgi:hypothetical protein